MADLLIEKLTNLKEEKSSLSNLIDYLIELIEMKKKAYAEDDFSDIEDIFDDFIN
jgi:predicted CopG family antitoxin